MNMRKHVLSIAGLGILSFMLPFIAQAETYTKLSEPFSFPGATSVFGNLEKTGMGGFASLMYRRLSDGRFILSWKLPEDIRRGQLSVFSLRGQKVAGVAIHSSGGEMEGTSLLPGPGAKGLFIFRLSAGPAQTEVLIPMFAENN